MARIWQVGFEPSDQPATFEDMADEVFGKARDVLIQRQKKYGPNNVTTHMLKGIAVRLADKLARLDRVAFDDAGDFDDETVEDVLVDICNYAAIGMCMRRGWWTPQGCPELKAEEPQDTPEEPDLTSWYAPPPGINLSNGDTFSRTITVSAPQEKTQTTCIACGTVSPSPRFVSTGEAGPFCSLTCVETHKPSTRAVISIAHDCDLESDACDCLDRDDNSTVTGTDRGYHAFSDGVRDNLPKMTKGQQMPKIIGK